MSKVNKLYNKRLAHEDWMWHHNEKGQRTERQARSTVTREFNTKSLPSTDASRAYVASHRSTRQ